MSLIPAAHIFESDHNHIYYETNRLFDKVYLLYT